MKKNRIPGIAGCLMFALILVGCGHGQDGWKDTGSTCTGTDWKDSKIDLSGAAKIYQSICEKGKVASDLRCKDKRLEVQCK